MGIPKSMDCSYQLALARAMVDVGQHAVVAGCKDMASDPLVCARPLGTKTGELGKHLCDGERRWPNLDSRCVRATASPILLLLSRPSHSGAPRAPSPSP